MIKQTIAIPKHNSLIEDKKDEDVNNEANLKIIPTINENTPIFLFNEALGKSRINLGANKSKIIPPMI
ncbi:hypothetical protein [Thermolongibacillus altinsuensis]|uniref:hypothetical protein n=1 Tax=Thermolongibacillus altinsuensis TaxID=575256 RepID=UPI00242A307A|nr:hypothetical protein [Thermolongibacillus altinsuensis]GMB10141.1 hypothetical protein B1no1_28510 [Thermolongibacillus altinsuensis]